MKRALHGFGCDGGALQTSFSIQFMASIDVRSTLSERCVLQAPKGVVATTWRGSSSELLTPTLDQVSFHQLDSQALDPHTSEPGIVGC